MPACPSCGVWGGHTMFCTTPVVSSDIKFEAIDPNFMLLEDVKDFLNQLGTEIYQDQPVEEIQGAIEKIAQYIYDNEKVPPA